MNATSVSRAGRARPREADAAFRISLARRSSAFSASQPLDLRGLLGRDAGTLAGVDFGLADPRPHRLRRNRCPASRRPPSSRHTRSGSWANLRDHAHRTLTKLRAVGDGRADDSIPQESSPHRTRSAVQFMYQIAPPRRIGRVKAIWSIQGTPGPSSSGLPGFSARHVMKARIAFQWPTTPRAMPTIPRSRREAARSGPVVFGAEGHSRQNPCHRTARHPDHLPPVDHLQGPSRRSTKPH